MKRIKLKITALSPLAIAANKSGSISQAEDYIPGSVIRGAIASQILQLSNQQTPGIAEQNLVADSGDFAALFLSDEPAIFHNAYPAVAKIANKSFLIDKEKTEKEKYDVISRVVNDEILVLPVTAVSSKTDSGFKPKANGVFDTLIDRFCADAYNYPYDPSDLKSLEEKTDARVEAYGSGFYSKTNDSETKYQYRSHSVSTRFLTRVGINRQRATSQDDIFYSIEVLNESFVENPQEQNWHSVVYRSDILVNDADLAKSLTDFINQNFQIFRLGSATSRGLGKVEITATISDTLTDVESRITEFNRQLKNRWQLWSVFSTPENNLLENRTYFTLDLQAEAIFTENWQRTTVISPKMLCKFVNLNDEFAQLNDTEEKENFIKLEVVYSSYNYRSGWNSAWGLMKDIELVTNRGAVYLFSTKKENEKKWTDKLKDLELNGVGDRTCEGFGQVQICNEFHSVFREEAV
ncbi:CRISPR-associated RAMP protein Csx10 [Komarekiella sp. 'clone 1']|uniref:CRISPR-associated RAMP protein Csx10 n=1 Tax=Komarekiella delphini-convector SJRDD-AB1 TaxID=2593771 RepID=A0AA40SUS0_9NOST|nr:CRISPR-associated RAMP protein Csx10 [Komarekiella delphini-convector]MBD6615636.1 CRISPR-associated RAMP protein Csx10 [Komarekiella delphini-convector SJRDD-AB1]